MSAADEYARELRKRLVADGTPDARLQREELVGALGGGGGGLDAGPAEVADAVLIHHGLRSSPPLRDAPDGSTVGVHVDRGLVLQGGLAVAALAAVVGYLGRPLYALLFVLAAGLTATAAWRHPTMFDVPGFRRLPRGRIFGAAASLVAVLIVAVVVVLPLRAHYRAESGVAAAKALVADAAARVAAGDVATTQMLLQRARSADASNPDIGRVEAQATRLEIDQSIQDALSKQLRYEAAERAFARGKLDEALHKMKSLGGFRDAAEKARRYAAAAHP